MKKAILVILIVLILAFLGYMLFSKSPSATNASGVLLFYGKECPHCQIVEDFINKNNIAQKVSFTQVEVFHNKDNSAILVEKYKACGTTDEKQMGVPMLWDGGKCYEGQEDVIKYFQDKTK
ncbi:MAG: hypothetical protein WCV59_04175 [Parcubacteria group bacterium]|jgi:glutaredoxin